MKLSDAIRDLQNLKKTHGNIEIQCVLPDPKVHFRFFDIVKITYDKYSMDEDFVAELEIVEQPDV